MNILQEAVHRNLWEKWHNDVAFRSWCWVHSEEFGDKKRGEFRIKARMIAVKPPKTGQAA